MAFVTDIKTFAALGCGVIGSGWVARALAHGLDVVAWDPAPGADAQLRQRITNCWPALEKQGLHSGASAPELTEGLIDRVVDGTTAQLGSHSIAALERYRDDCLLAVQQAVRQTKLQHGISLDE